MFSWKDAGAPAKVLTFFTCVFLVSLGLCGLSLFSGFGGMQAGILELVLMLVSATGIILTVIVALIHGTITGRSSEMQTLFGNRGEEKQAERQQAERDEQ